MIDILVPYFKAGLENNELCVWIISRPLEVEEAKNALRIAVPDIDIYLEKGQMEIIPYTQGYLKEGVFDPDRVVNSWIEKIDQALATGYNGLRASGDNRWLEKEGWNGFVDYENKIDAIIDSLHVIALCPYYLDMCSTSEIIDVVSNHQFALIKREGKWEQIENSGRKRAEKEAIQAAKNWKYTFDAVPDLIAIIDKEYRVVNANRAMAARLGITPEECAGLTCYRMIHGTDSPPSFCPHQQSFKDGTQHISEVFEDCLGGYFSVSTSQIHDSEGKFIGSVYVAHDINERKKVEEKLKESEEKYRNIIEIANEGILIIDAEVRITYANKKIVETLGYSPEELIGQFLWNFADEDGRNTLELNLEKRRQGINDVYELKLICKCGSPLWALISPKALFNKEGVFTGSLGLFTDITERKQKEDRINRYNSVLAGINRIFSSVVQAKTEEELGNTCLSVALEVTGSQFGFINEMGADGLLHDIAKSELAWKQCLMYDKTGHCGLPSDFVVHGLYGSVIINGEGFFANDPQSHPESIGLPHGHPPIESFLGVPLIQDGEIMGVIAVANREGGYTYEQQEDLEAIALSVTQALQRKRSEEALRSSNSYNRSLIEASLDPLVTIGPDGKITDVNVATEQVTGYSRNELIGTDFSDYFTEPEKVHKGYRQVFINGEVRDYPLEIQHKNGRITPVLYNGSIYKDETGKVIGVFATARDITERKKAEERLKFVNRYNRSLIEASLDAFVTIGPDGKITDVNGATELITGYPGNKLIGTDFSDYFTEPEKARAGYQHVFVNGEVRDYPLEVRHRDGHEIPVLYNASIYKDDNGKVIGVFAAARDITELKKAESKIQALANAVESSDDAIITKSLDGIIISWNKGAGKVYGYSAEEVLGKDISMLEPDNLKGEIRHFSEKIRQGEKVQHYETLRLKKNGKIINVSVTLSPVYDTSGKLVAVSTIARDVTQRKRAEEALRLSNIYNRNLIEVSLDPLVTIGSDGKITDVNVATELVTGYSRKELIGTDFSDYFTEPERARTGYRQAFIQGEIRDYPLEIQHKDGHATPILYNASIYKDEAGKVIGVFAAARDITELKEAEKALKKAYDSLEKLVKERTTELEKAYESLKESEEGLAEAQIMAHIGNWDQDLINDRGYWSDELYRIFRRNPQDPPPSYDGLLNYIHPDDRDYVDKSIKRGLKEGPKDGIDYRIILANGEERTVHSRAEVIFDERNVPVRVKGIVQDVTERRKTEEKVRILANAVESSNDAIVTFSPEGIVLSWNKGAEQIYGYSAEEIIGKNISIVEPDDLKGEIKRFSEKVKKGESQRYEALRLKKDGTLVNISAILSPVYNASGQLVALSAIGRDITEHKREEKALRESEARLRRFYESGMFGVLYYNTDGSITDANDKFLEIVGYSRENLQAGKVNWKKMTPPEYRLLDEDIVEELKTTGGNVVREKEYIRKDGSHVPVILGVATFDREHQEGIAFVIDNTERKKAEKALAEIDRIRIKEIHHRIKNNLQVISSLLDLQAEKFQDKQVLEAFRESQNRVISMALIHEELYKGDGMDSLDFSAYLQELAENLFQTYKLRSKNIRLLMELEDNIFFDMDTAVPLGIIVNELVSNSLKHAFTEGKEGEIQIRLFREEKSDEACEKCNSLFSLTISDNGKGIPENAELGCFESLGLQLVNALIDQLDGKTELNRAHGTEFRITFSVAERP